MQTLYAEYISAGGSVAVLAAARSDRFRAVITQAPSSVRAGAPLLARGGEEPSRSNSTRALLAPAVLTQRPAHGCQVAQGRVAGDPTLARLMRPKDSAYNPT